MINEGAVKGILVTTSDFGSDSIKFARYKPIMFINGHALLSMFK